MNDRLITLLAKKKSGEINLQEQKELKDLLSANTDSQIVANTLDAFYNLPIYQAEADGLLWKNIHKKINQDDDDVVAMPLSARPKIFSLKRMVIAASFLIVLSTAALIYYQSPTSERKQNIVATKGGSRSSLVLPDGSQVWLNAESKISYSDNFGKSNRELTLIGEAYFDVAKDKNKPFIIHTKEMDVKVVGTVFNLRAYPDEKTTEAALYSGAIEVMINRDKKQVIYLKPNEKLLVQNNYSDSTKEISPAIPLISVTAITKTTTDSIAVESQWVQNRFAFSNESLETVAQRISKWFGVQVVIKNDALKNKEFNGLFYNPTLHQVMESLKLAGELHYKIDENIVTIE